MLRQPLSQQLPCLLQHARRAASTAKKPPISQKVRFIDQLRVTVRGGHGGGGSSALFGRTGHHPRAAGGNGASGGSVILRATKHLTGLGTVPLHIDAERGGNGGKQWMDGKKGADKIVPVPLGTLVYQLIELQGRDGMSVPHGVTALPHRATSITAAAPGQLHACVQQYQPPMPQQQQPSATCCALDGVPQAAAAVAPAASQQQPLDCQSQDEHSDRQPVQRSKRLFADDQLRSADAHGSMDDQEQQSWASINTRTTAAPASRDAVLRIVSNEAAAKLAPTAADSLYEQLVKCRRLLTNSEKLHILQTGRLPGSNQEQYNASAASSASLPWVEEGSGSQSDESDSHGSSNRSYAGKETASSTHPEGEWSDDAGEDLSDSEADQDFWGGGEQLPPHFSKQQVWSVLESQAVLLGELDRDGQELVVAAGGSGGRGNAVAASRPNRPATRSRSNGTLGQEVMLLLKLRLLADVVLVGLPNVGKSSLIVALTDARAQIGSYAFTTLRPQLGIIKDNEFLPSVAARTTDVGQTLSSSDWSGDNTSATAGDSVLASAAATAGTGPNYNHHDGKTTAQLAIADLPGLVPGAHAGKGRGMAFLAHLQKARCLALVIDMTGRDAQQQAQGQHGASTTTDVHGACDDAAAWGTLVPYMPQQQLSILQDELSQYDSTVMQMPMLIVANKMDALSPDAAALALQQLKTVTDLPMVPISAKQGAGLHRLRTALQLLVSRVR